MAGIGLLLGALSGGGRGLASSVAEEQRFNDQSALDKQRSDLEEQKALRIAEANRVATRQAGIQQGQDISNETQRLQNQRDADAINAANAGVEGGSNMSAADAATLRTAPEEARKAYGLLAPTRQSSLEDRATAAANLGYLDAAREARGELQTEVQGQRFDQQSKDTNRRLDQQEKRQEALDKYQQRREDRLDRISEAQISYQKSRDSRNDEKSEQAAVREERAATVAAMKGAETDVKQLQKEIADPMLAPEQKAVLQGQLDLARADARRFRNALGGAGIDGGQKPTGTFDPNNYRSGGSSDKPRGGTTVPNPVQDDKYEPVKLKDRSEPAAAASPRDTAIRALDAALQATSRQLAAANSSNDRAEIVRLSEVFKQQNEARQRAMQQ